MYYIYVFIPCAYSVFRPSNPSCKIISHGFRLKYNIILFRQKSRPRAHAAAVLLLLLLLLLLYETYIIIISVCVCDARQNPMIRVTSFIASRWQQTTTVEKLNNII